MIELPRFTFCHVALFGAFLSAVTSSAAPSRPNILLIVPDQMRAGALGCEGNRDVSSPHIDRLASGGMRFTHAFANTPVCCPARAVMLTGTYAHVNGMRANDLRLHDSQVSIAEILRDAGYRTGFVGKWHLDGGPREPGFVPPGPRRQGFDFWAAYQCHHQHFVPYYFRDTAERIVVPKFEPEASCDFAVEFLRSQPEDRPFFLTVMMGPPHDPYGAPAEYMERYDPERITPPPNWQPTGDRGSGPGSPGIPAAFRHLGLPEVRYVPNGGRQEIAAYYAAITAIDDQVGRLVRTLQETGANENTIILFTSDHGDMLGSHGMRHKRRPHRESAQVPAILRWPARIPAGRMVDTLFSHVDMAPTLLALAGINPPLHMQGADLSRVALGQTTRGPDAVLLQIFVPSEPDGIPGPWRGIITDRYTYARLENQPWVLFDNKSDPWQMDNLAEDPRQAQIARRLDARLTALMKRHGDAWSFNTTQPVEDGRRLYRDRTFYTIEEYLEHARTNPEAIQ